MSLSSHAFSSYEPKNARSFCPHCQRTHRWTKDGMVLRDDEAENEREPVTERGARALLRPPPRWRGPDRPR